MASRQPSFLDTIHERRAGDADTSKISLLDRTKSSEEIERLDTEVEGTERGDSDTSGLPLTKKLTSNSLKIHKSVRQQVARQKYRRYDRERYDLNNTSSENDHPQAQSEVETAAQGVSHYIERGRVKAKGMIKRKKGLGRGKNDEDTAVDILWENQRGVFFFGMPRYSSNSLLPSDPKPWQNSQFRTSPVDIRNAQVPDPSWEWAWKSWYVDMSRDVDEEGWEYSFAFRINFDWHGNHPWFHSFVRRRRWLRMRKRKSTSQPNTKATSHDLASEYFTIHPQETRSTREEGSRTRTSIVKDIRNSKAVNTDEDNAEISSIGGLMRYLKGAVVDREKLSAIRSFVACGGDELHYLSERMSDIMNLLIYQTSRRQVLADLKRLTAEADEEKQKMMTHDHSNNEQEQQKHEQAERRIENLERAINAADAQVRELEYWSDIKSMTFSKDNVQNRRSSQALENPAAGSYAFQSKQAAHEPGNSLHEHPEHQNTSDAAACIEGETESSPESKRSSEWFDTMQSVRSMGSSDDATPLERYTTPAESASTMGTPLSLGKQSKRRTSAHIASLGGILDDSSASYHKAIGFQGTHGAEGVPPRSPTPNSVSDNE